MNYSHFVGLDVGKKTFDASLMSADEKELSHKSFDNTPTGIQSLLDWIAGYHLSLSKLWGIVWIAKWCRKMQPIVGITIP